MSTKVLRLSFLALQAASSLHRSKFRFSILDGINLSRASTVQQFYLFSHIVTFYWEYGIMGMYFRGTSDKTKKEGNEKEAI